MKKLIKNGPDGFNGARDARILADYADEDGGARGVVRVPAVGFTMDILKRAGVRVRRVHEFYPVRVVRDEMNRLQLASPVVVPPLADAPPVVVPPVPVKADFKCCRCGCDISPVVNPSPYAWYACQACFENEKARQSKTYER